MSFLKLMEIESLEKLAAQARRFAAECYGARHEYKLKRQAERLLARAAKLRADLERGS